MTVWKSGQCSIRLPFFRLQTTNQQPGAGDAARGPILGLDGVTWPPNHQSNHMFNISRHENHNFVEINWNQVQFMEFKSKFLQNNSSHQVTVNAIYWRRAELNAMNRADVPRPWNDRGRDWLTPTKSIYSISSNCDEDASRTIDTWRHRETVFGSRDDIKRSNEFWRAFPWKISMASLANW